MAADKIVVLDQGRVAEQGTHAELLAKGGPYAHMWADYERAASWQVDNAGEGQDASMGDAACAPARATKGGEAAC